VNASTRPIWTRLFAFIWMASDSPVSRMTFCELSATAPLTVISADPNPMSRRARFVTGFGLSLIVLIGCVTWSSGDQKRMDGPLTSRTIMRMNSARVMSARLALSKGAVPAEPRYFAVLEVEAEDGRRRLDPHEPVAERRGGDGKRRVGRDGVARRG
jgi:hypothetical protein